MSVFLEEKRLSKVEFEKQIQSFQQFELLKKAFDCTNILVIIINQQRQIVFANKAFLNLVSKTDLDSVLGKRLGEVIYCVHAEEGLYGCGSSPDCEHCDALNIIMKSISKGDVSSGEAILVQRLAGKDLPLNLLEYVVPLKMGEHNYYVVSFMDISDTIRRRSMEKVFFHDIINSAGALKGLIGLLKDEVTPEIEPEVEFIEYSFQALVEEIISQKQLLEAENDELEVDMITLNTIEILNIVKRYFKYYEIERNQEIVLGEAADTSFKSDYNLLLRVLNNMVKNALEASNKGEKVTLGCKLIEENSLRMWVHNQQVISPEVKPRLFQRSFSTKSLGRGWGTYSMKLFGERYLNGTVGFQSEEDQGTTFYLDLPLN